VSGVRLVYAVVQLADTANVLAQEGFFFEVKVIDDGSADQTGWGGQVRAGCVSPMFASRTQPLLNDACQVKSEFAGDSPTRNSLCVA